MKIKTKKWKRTILRYIRHKEFVGMILLFLIAWYLSGFYYQLMLLQGDSMEPAYHSGQFLILDKHSGDYDYGDVIAFQKDGFRGYLVKRIAAMPGDGVCIRDGILYVNGLPQDAGTRRIDFAGIAGEQIFLGEDDYFVLGDHFDRSTDSRYEEIGLVNRDEIKGKVVR